MPALLNKNRGFFLKCHFKMPSVERFSHGGQSDRNDKIKNDVASSNWLQTAPRLKTFVFPYVLLWREKVGPSEKNQSPPLVSSPAPPETVAGLQPVASSLSSSSSQRLLRERKIQTSRVTERNTFSIYKYPISFSASTSSTFSTPLSISTERNGLPITNPLLPLRVICLSCRMRKI